MIAIRCERCAHIGFIGEATLPRILVCGQCGDRKLAPPSEAGGAATALHARGRSVARGRAGDGGLTSVQQRRQQERGERDHGEHDRGGDEVAAHSRKVRSDIF
jgi:hypothetical protein